MAISLRGSAFNSGTDGADVTVTLPVGTADGDTVVVTYAIASTTDKDMVMLTSGYAELADIYSNDNQDANLGLFWKRQGSTPDTTAQVEGRGTGGDGVAANAAVFIGVDSTTSIDATTTTDSGINGPIPDAPSITTVTNGAWVVAGTASASGAALGAPSAPSGYAGTASENSSDDRFANSILIWKEVAVAGAEDPGSIGGLSGGNTNHSWAAATVALRPAATAFARSFGFIF